MGSWALHPSCPPTHAPILATTVSYAETMARLDKIGAADLGLGFGAASGKWARRMLIVSCCIARSWARRLGVVRQSQLGYLGITR